MDPAGKKHSFSETPPLTKHDDRLHLQNHIVRWGCSLSFVFFATLTILVTSISDAILHHPDLVNGPNFELTLHVLVGILSLVLLRRLIFWKAKRLNSQYLARFQSIDDLGTFVESRSLIHLPGTKPYRHAVLLLHGFTASTQEFAFLAQKLRDAGIPHVAPMLPGFGTDEARVLHNVSRKDWFRAAVESFDLLANLADEVSIVGHSLGGMLGVATTKYRKPKHLILSAPGLYSVSGDQKYKTLLTRPFISDLYITLVPFLPKPIRKGRVSPSDTLDADYCRRVFQFLAVPIRSVKQLFLLQNETDIAKVNCEKLSVIYGSQDQTVDMGVLFATLDRAGVPYQKFEFKDSAHNVLEDRQRDEACATVVDIITGGPATED
jgi:carboxylesterase